MPEITQIRNEADYEAALARIDALIHSVPGSAEDAELDRISDLVVRYEDERYPIADPAPDALVEFLLDQGMVTREQLLPLVGSNANLDAVIAGHREITPELALLLHEYSGIPVENLLKTPVDAATAVASD